MPAPAAIPPGSSCNCSATSASRRGSHRAISSNSSRTRNRSTAPSGAEQDFTDLHAWCEVYLPGAGWVGLDPTSGLFAGEGHIPLACAANPTHAAPISGELEECEVSFEFEMSIRRVVEPPRVTKPYTDDQWRAIDRLGDRIDVLLKDGDVRLTMGGRADLRLDRRHGRRGMDHSGGRPHQARLGPTR